MCGGSANQRCLPAHTNGERFRLTVARPARATPLARGITPWSALGASSPTRARYRGDHDQPAVGSGLLLAVAEPVALGHARDVEDRAAVLGRLVVAQPQPGADARPEAGLRELLLQPREFLGPQVADEHGVQRQPGRAQPVHPADDLLDGVRAVRAVQRQVQGEALQADVLDRRVQLAEVLLGDSVAAHRAHALDDHPGPHQTPDPVQRGHRADDPVGQRHRVLAPPERGEDEQVAAEPVLDAGGLVRRSHGQDVGAHAGRLLAEPLVAEAVAVALADRDQSGESVLDLLLVRTPARGVDVERERHARPEPLLRSCVVQRCCLSVCGAGCCRVSGATCRCRGPCAAPC